MNTAPVAGNVANNLVVVGDLLSLIVVLGLAVPLLGIQQHPLAPGRRLVCLLLSLLVVERQARLWLGSLVNF